jgi:hypothetical protein
VVLLAGLVLVAGPVGVPGSSGVTHATAESTSSGSRFGWTSANWSGYAITSGPYTSVTGTWAVPAVSPSTTPTYSAAWVGIDGHTGSNLIQVGTEQDYYDGEAHYSAWWEILPAAGQEIATLVVHPGDRMSATITKDATGGTWTIALVNLTTGEDFRTSQPYLGSGASAEWIQEAPTVGGRTATLAQYSPFTFVGTANGRNPGLVATNGGAMVQHGVTVSTPSLPNSRTGAFSVQRSSIPGAVALKAARQVAAAHTVRLSWSAAASNGSTVATYRIYRVTGVGQRLVATVGNVRTWTDTGSAATRGASYRVVAVNGIGAGPASNVARAV